VAGGEVVIVLDGEHRLIESEPALFGAERRVCEEAGGALDPAVTDRRLFLEIDVVHGELHGDAGGSGRVIGGAIELIGALVGVEGGPEVIEPEGGASQAFEGGGALVQGEGVLKGGAGGWP
jgi:hypothetical protein